MEASGTLLADDPLPVQDGGTGSPMGLALGAGHVLWFALAYTGDMPAYLGKLDTTSGQVTQYPVSLAGEGGNGYVARAPDGSVFMNEYANDKIARLSADGTFCEIDVPTANSGADRLAVGPDGSLWFTEQQAGMVGQLDAGGRIGEYQLDQPAGSVPAGIAFDEAGNLWLTMRDAGRVVEIAADSLPAAEPTATATSSGTVTPATATPAAGQVSMHLHETYDAAGRRTMLTCARGNSAHKRQRSQRHINTPTHYAKTEP